MVIDAGEVRGWTDFGKFELVFNNKAKSGSSPSGCAWIRRIGRSKEGRYVRWCMLSIAEDKKYCGPSIGVCSSESFIMIAGICLSYMYVSDKREVCESRFFASWSIFPTCT